MPTIPLEPLDPVEPEEPAEPLEPLEPDDPLKPDVPDRPEEPLEPLDPEDPLVPDVPEVPDIPEVPDVPANPLVPEVTLTYPNCPEATLYVIITGVSWIGRVVKFTLPVTPKDPVIIEEPVKNNWLLFNKVKFPLPLKLPPLLYCNE